MSDIPFLGCKISLISKCDIRYEGILYCVDAKESTIALSKVRSHGTENRGDPANFVPPKNDIYDMIIFRASDVKDLRVDAPTGGLQDPAIVSAHHSYPESYKNNTDGSPPTSGQSNQIQSQQQPQPSSQQQKPLLPFLPTGAASNSGSNQINSTNNKEQHQPPTNYSSAVANAQRRSQQHSTNNTTNSQQQHNSRDKKPQGDVNRGGKRDERAHSNNEDKRRNDDHHSHHQNSRRDDQHRRDDKRGGDDRRGDRNLINERRGGEEGRRGGGPGGDRRGPGPRNDRSGGYENNRNHANPKPRHNSGTNDSVRRGGRYENSRTGGGGGGFRRGPEPPLRRARSGDRNGPTRGPMRGPRKPAPLKFDGEYDFDKANQLFLELEGKLKLEDVEKDGKSETDGANQKGSTGQSESGSGYDSEDQHNHKDRDSKNGCSGSVSGEYYDKTKSFFDNISCEASERGQGKVNKTDWRKERQINVETFGVSTTYRRGPYRGRFRGPGQFYRS